MTTRAVVPMSTNPANKPSQWRDAANVLRNIAAEWDLKAEREICAVISNCGVGGAPLACGYPPHVDGTHSWASLPTFSAGEA